MPYKVLPDSRIIHANRVLINGAPNTGKTHSFRTWPHSKDSMLFILLYPGEGGGASVPQDEGIKTFTFEEEPGKKVSSAVSVREVKQLTIEILSGKYGPCGTFAGDGLHKFADLVLDDVTGGAYLLGEDFKPNLYKAAYNIFLNYIKMVNISPVPRVVMTSWEGREAERPKKPGEPSATNIPTHIYPEMPGKLAKWIMGEFPIVVNSQTKQVFKGGKIVTQFAWQLQADDEVRGCGVKGPAEITSKLPKYCAQDWRVLEGLLEGEA